MGKSIAKELTPTPSFGIPKVSIIIPVYNTAQYIRESILSITAQTIKDIEIIAVNDGSKDDSLSIMEGLAKEDTRIRLFTQDNAGQSVARNVGIDNARGEYIYFMDSDDLLESDALELCYLRCLKDNLDFVIFDADVFCEDPTCLINFDYRRAGYVGDKIYSGMELLKLLRSKNAYTVSPCLSVVRKSYISSIGLYFYPGIIHEDELYSAQLYIPAARIGAIERDFFHRRVRPDSVMTSVYSKRTITGYLTVMRQMKIYKIGKSHEVTAMILGLMNTMLGAVMYNASSMPLPDRMSLLWHAISHYPCLLNIRSCVALMCPAIKKIKQSIG